MNSQAAPAQLLVIAACLVVSVICGCASPSPVREPESSASGAGPSGQASSSLSDTREAHPSSPASTRGGMLDGPSAAPRSPVVSPSPVLDSQSVGSGSPATPATPTAAPSEVAAIAAVAHPLTGAADDYDALIAQLARADIVLLGEPSHGTHEVYEERAEITRRLIDEAGFSGIAIEGDWPDAWRVDRYVRAIGEETTADEALAEFDEFPAWMWRNQPFAELVGWLREHNEGLPYARQAGVYGLDLYSLADSIAAVPLELAPFDRGAAERIERRYACAGEMGTGRDDDDRRPCAERVRVALREAITVHESMPTPDPAEADRTFSALQNARVVVNGRRYALGEGADNDLPWNMRDRHMAETLWALRDHLQRTGRSGSLVVWAHNSHIGDARATDVAHHGQLNLGQLVREKRGIESVLVGFSTYTGTVTAADAWGYPPEEMDVLPALPGSHPALLHAGSQAGAGDFLLYLGPDAPAPLHQERLERYIGVLYLPLVERASHYLATRIADEYDVLIHLDETTAVEPLDERIGDEPAALPDADP